MSGYDAFIPCPSASITGVWTTQAVLGVFGFGYTHYPPLAVLEPDALLYVKIAFGSLIFGLTSWLFISLIEYLRHSVKFLLRWSPLRFVIGGILIIVLTVAVGSRDYQGFNLGLIVNSTNGKFVPSSAFILEIIFTVLALGAGYLGGEVGPALVIGRTLGYALGTLFGINPGFMASIGFVATLTGVIKAPLTCVMLGMELLLMAQSPS